MAKSSKSTSPRKGASKTSKKIQAYAKARAKALAARQATAKPDEAPSGKTGKTGKTPSARKTELLKQIQAGFEELYGEPPELIAYRMQKYHPESLSEERLQELVDDLKALNTFQEMFLTYDDLSVMLQDFQTLLENQVVQTKKKIADAFAQEGSLALAYYRKMLMLHLNISYNEDFLKYTGKFTGDTNKYRLHLKRTQLYRDIPSIFVGNHSDEHHQEETHQVLNQGIETIFFIIHSMANPANFQLPDSYQSYRKDMQECVSNFALQRAQAILDLNDKYAKTPMDTALLSSLLHTLGELGVKDPTHKLAQPFEDFLSDDIFYGLPLMEESMLLFPDLLRLELKYETPILLKSCSMVFQQSYRWYSLPPEQFIAQMKELKENREKQLKEAH